MAAKQPKDLSDAIVAFNAACGREIEFGPTRTGRIRAKLPRLDKEIVLQGDTVGGNVMVSAMDMALLCEEARLAIAGATKLLDAASRELRKMI